MANLGSVSKFNINGNELNIKDAALTEIVGEIIEAIGANNGDISERINNLHERSFDALIKISSNNESEIASIQDGIYKLQYVTITIEDEEEIETLENSAILIQQGINQYLYKNGQLSSRTNENNLWSEWEVKEIISTLSNNYSMATGVNIDLALVAGDTYEEAFSKLEKALIDDERTIAASINEINAKIPDSIVTSIDGATGAVTLNYPVTSVNGATGAIIITETQLSKGVTGIGNAVTDINVSNHHIKLIKGATYTTSTDVQNIVATGIANLVNSAPATLDTLNELAAALGNDENFATTIATQIGEKYTKPNTGIPITDLATGIQTSLTLADSALQEAPVTSVNGMTGAISLTIPNEVTDSIVSNWGFTKNQGQVESFNGMTGAIVYNPPVESVNGMTGTIIIPENGVTSFNGATGAITYTAPVTSVNGMTGAVTVSGLQTVTSADNGKILMVVNGAWTLVSPSVLYSGSGAPNNSQGNNGDLFIQTD